MTEEKLRDKIEEIEGRIATVRNQHQRTMDRWVDGSITDEERARKMTALLRREDELREGLIRVVNQLREQIRGEAN